MTKKLIAFSLVELMISLITISCIAAAFTPVITKKLKKQDVALSLAQTSEIMSPCPATSYYTADCKLCTQKYCIQCSIDSCSSGNYLDISYCGCKSCSDKFGANCTACTKDACTKCKTGKNGYILQNGECKQCTSPNIYANEDNTCSGSCTAKNGYYCDDNGVLHPCSFKYSTQCSRCDKNNCTACNSYYFLNSSKSPKDCTGCGMSYCSSCTSTTVCTACQSDALLNTDTKKCVYAANDSDTSNYIPHCANYTYKTSSPASTNNSYAKTNFKCSICKGGYYVTNSGASCTLCTAISQCKYCDNSGKCLKCNAGYAPNTSGACTACNIANCSTCAPDGTCASCNQKYHLSSDKKSCVSDDNKFNCSDSNFMQIGNLCVTRKNMGDGYLLTIPNSVNVVEPLEYCYAGTSKCCWKGATSTSCDSENGGYSGCNRTVCNWSAAKDICSNFKYGDLDWRLPTKEEMSLWARYSQNLTTQGLQLCDRYAGYLSARCANAARCPGTYDGNCNPFYVWSGTESSAGVSAYRYNLESGTWHGPLTYVESCGFSVRCVADFIK